MIHKQLIEIQLTTKIIKVSCVLATFSNFLKCFLAILLNLLAPWNGFNDKGYTILKFLGKMKN